MFVSYDRVNLRVRLSMWDVTYITHESLSRYEHGARSGLAQVKRAQPLESVRHDILSLP